MIPAHVDNEKHWPRQLFSQNTLRFIIDHNFKHFAVHVDKKAHSVHALNLRGRVGSHLEHHLRNRITHIRMNTCTRANKKERANLAIELLFPIIREIQGGRFISVRCPSSCGDAGLKKRNSSCGDAGLKI